MNLWLKRLALAGVAVGVVLTGLGGLAAWRPPLDIVNDGFPFWFTGLIVVAWLSVRAGDWRLILTATALIAINAATTLATLQGAADAAPAGSERALRVLTFNLWRGNSRIEDVAKFLAEADADAVVLQEVTREHGDVLRARLKAAYPHNAGDQHLIILSKHPILAEGQIDRPGFPPWSALMLRWVRIEVEGTAVEIAGVHLARPFYPTLQEEDLERLIAFALDHNGPLILAGDFNMTPWTEKLNRLIRTTGLRRYNTFHFTWPLKRKSLPLVPFVTIDNVLASPDFAKIATRVGPSLGSDHRPVIADLAFSP
ncbi:MAG TPA: endonuclease/exonuclease/phosphatase family protein [Methyloceanibacter sp.]|nr:endonuclease/exonuclease/phosphatase family protein [Methyloceanibacter sp.]